MERTHLSKRVIDVVERKLEDVDLGEPAVTGVKVLAVSFRLNLPWGVFLFDPVPLLISLSWRSLWVSVDPVLELIDGDAVWEEADGASKMGVTVFVRLIEEEIHIWFGEEFHGHRMDFAGFGGR